MNTDFLSPVESVVLAHNELLPAQAIGNSIQIHTEKEGIPELEGVKMALIGVDEFRNAKVQREDHLKLKEFRRQFYLQISMPKKFYPITLYYSGLEILLAATFIG